MAKTASKRTPKKKPSQSKKAKTVASQPTPTIIDHGSSGEDPAALGIGTTGDTSFDKELAANAKKSMEGGFKTLGEQIDAEYQLSWLYMKPKFDEWGLRLKLLNNQRRDKEAVGDTLLFTIHQTVLASLYDDKLMVTFAGREEGDDDAAENLTDMAKFDYEEMRKDELDYNWDWDALFYGRGLELLYEFDRNRMCPAPENLDPMTFMRDPRATSANGDMQGRGAMRYWGREIRLTKDEMRRAGVYFNFEDLKPDAQDIKSYLDEAGRLRDMASGRTNIQHLMIQRGENAEIKLLEWNTWWNGQRVMVTLGDNKKRIVRFHVYGKEYQRRWPVIDRPLFPIANDWDGVSIPDLVEDKQRARAVLQNLGLKGAKADVHPMYMYNSSTIKNRNDLNFGFNKFVPVEGNPEGQVIPMPRSQAGQQVQWIMQLLNEGAERATATPNSQQGALNDTKRTATELSLVNSNVDTRYSLAARVFGWSEKRFWNHWYMQYKLHFKGGIDEKIVRINGAMGSNWKPMTRENLITSVDPDVKVESKAISDAKRANDLNAIVPLIPLYQSDKNVNLRYLEKRVARLSGMHKDEIDMLIPPTASELQAADENVLLGDDKLVDVNVNDDHRIHIEVHNKASDTPARLAHINAHKKALILQRTNPTIAPPMPSDQNPSDGQPAVPFMPGGGVATPTPAQNTGNAGGPGNGALPLAQ